MANQGKPAVDVILLGHTDHGMTTLAAAISQLQSGKNLARAARLDDIDNPPEQKMRGVTVAASRVSFETESRRYTLTDCYDHFNREKVLLASPETAAGAILVISAPDGLQSQTRELLALARTVGIPSVVVFLNKTDLTDDDDEMLELVEMEVQELLGQYGYQGDDTPIVTGSALQALEGETGGDTPIAELLANMDSHIKVPSPKKQSSFLMPVEDISKTGHNTVITGRIERGVIKPFEKVQLVGIGAAQSFTVTGLEMFRQSLDKAEAGENVGLALRGARQQDLETGMVAAKPGSIAAFNYFKATAYFLRKDEGGRPKEFFSGYRPEFAFHANKGVTGVVKLPEGMEMARLGEVVNFTVTLITTVALEEGMRFNVQEAGRPVGAGVVTALLEK